MLANRTEPYRTVASTQRCIAAANRRLTATATAVLIMTSLLPRSHETNHVIVENSGEVNVTPTADDVDVEKSERLNRASKKFLKACDQIKQIRKRIAELASMYSSLEKQHQQQYRLQLMQQHQNDVSSSSPSSLSAATHLDNSGQHSSSTSSTPSPSPTSSPNVNTAANSSVKINVNRFRETVRQQIENLQSIKSVYFIYANTKADEITRLQCELYGADAVRMAYETSNAVDTSPSSSSSYHNSSSSTHRTSARSEASEPNNRSESQLNSNYFMDTSTSRPQNDSAPSSSRPGQIDFLAV